MPLEQIYYGTKLTDKRHVQVSPVSKMAPKDHPGYQLNFAEQLIGKLNFAIQKQEPSPSGALMDSIEADPD